MNLNRLMKAVPRMYELLSDPQPGIWTWIEQFQNNAYEATAALTEMSIDERVVYLKGLEPGERVMETGVSGMQGWSGTVYIGTRGDTCVMWDDHGSGKMGTSATSGTRRIRDVLRIFNGA